MTGEPHEVHRDLKGCARDERCDAVPPASMLETSTAHRLQEVETIVRAVDSMGIAGSDLGRPALAGLSSLTTWISGVEETIATAESCDDVKAQTMASERQTTTRAVTSDSSTISAAKRLTWQKNGMIESLVLQHEIAMLLLEAFEHFKAIHTAVQELYMHCAELVQQRQASMPEQALTASAADSKEAHTDIQQASNGSHTDEVTTTDDSSTVQCGEGSCDAGGDAAPARFDAGEAAQYTAADFHP